MSISLPPELQRFVDEQVASGSYASRDDVIAAALESMRQARQFGDFKPGELDALIAEGERSLREEGPAPAAEVFDELRRRSRARRGEEP